MPSAAIYYEVDPLQRIDGVAGPRMEVIRDVGKRQSYSSWKTKTPPIVNVFVG